MSIISIALLALWPSDQAIEFEGQVKGHCDIFYIFKQYFQYFDNTLDTCKNHRF